MTPIDFLRVVLPPTGIYCIATPFPKGGFDHKVFDVIEDAAAYCDKVSSIENVYFSTHTLKNPRIWNLQHHRDKITKQWTPGWSVRTQKNVRSSRILFFDLDVGISEEKKLPKYATQLEAATALMDFIKVTGLPKPMIVSSGVGLHIYWVLDRELDSHTEWLTLAQRLKQLAAHHKLRFDPSRTTDQASVLRVAGTFNHKGGQKRLVDSRVPPVIVTVEDFGTALLGGLGRVQITPKAEIRPTVEGLGNNTKKEFEGTPPPMQAVLRACPQMRKLASERGNHGYNEWWFGDIGIGKFTAEGREAVHKLSGSGGYKGYSRAETDEKIDSWRSGPTTCARLAEVCGAALCEKCEYVGDNTSPVWAGHLLDRAPPPKITQLVGTELVEQTIPDPPMPFKRERVGGISMLVESKEGKQYSMPIYPYDLHPLERSATKDTEQQLWRAYLPHNVIKDFPIEASTFVDDRALLSRLANNGIYAPKFSELKNYMSAYIQELQRLRPVAAQHNRLGWFAEQTKFVMANRVFRCDGAAEPPALSKTAAGAVDLVSKRGGLQEQVRLLHFYDHKAYVANKFALLCSLGSPMFPFTGHHGVVVNITGETGASKSTTLYAAGSLWGPPLKYVMNGTKNGATALYRDAHRDLLSNLPTCIDEITNIAADVAKEFTFNATQPGGRKGLKRDGSRRETNDDDDRSSITITTANTSLHSLLQINNGAGAAGSVRTFEIRFKKRGIHLPHEANAFIRGIKENYGHAGENFIAVLVANRDRIKRRVIETMDRLGITAKIRDEERFWFAVGAVAIVAGEIAVKMGLISWDIQEIEDWFLNVQIPQMRGTVSDEIESGSPLAMMMNYIEHINGDMVKTAKPIGSPVGANIPHQPIQAPRGEMLAHYETDIRIMYVLKDGFRRWCERRGAYSQSILRELNAMGVVPQMDVKRTLGQFTNHAKGRSTCFVLDMNHAAIADVQLAVINQPAVPAGGTKLKTVK